MTDGMRHGGTVYRTVEIVTPSWPSDPSSSPSAANAFVCQTVCALDTWCRAWNYWLHDSQGGSCSLMSNVGTPYVLGASPPINYRYVTGVRDVEFWP